MQSFMVRCGKGISAPDLPGQRFRLGSLVFRFSPCPSSLVPEGGEILVLGYFLKFIYLSGFGTRSLLEALEIFDLVVACGIFSCDMWDLLP